MWKNILNRVNKNKPEHIALLFAWVLLVVLSLVIVDVKLLSYIHQNAYTKAAFVVVIQAIGFALLMSMKASKSNSGNAS